MRVLPILILVILLSACATQVSYTPVTSNPATINYEQHMVWGSDDPIWGTDKSVHFATGVGIQSIDGVPVENRYGKPYQIDGGKHIIQLNIADLEEGLVGTFSLTFDAGRTYGIIAARNPKIHTDGLAITDRILSGKVTLGALEEWKDGDPRSYAYEIRIYDLTANPIHEVVSIKTVAVNTFRAKPAQ